MDDPGSNHNSTVTSYEKLCILGDLSCANKPDRRTINPTEVKITIECPPSSLRVAPRTTSNTKQDVEMTILVVTNCGGVDSHVSSYLCDNDSLVKIETVV